MFRGLSVSSRSDGPDGSSGHTIRMFASCTHTNVMLYGPGYEGLLAQSEDHIYTYHSSSVLTLTKENITSRQGHLLVKAL